MNNTQLPPVIRTRELSKKYGSTVAIDSVNIEVHQGEIYGFVGPNGAGKTTLMKALVGLIHPTSGSFEILGQSKLSNELLRRVGVMIESPAFHPGMTGRQNLAYIARFANIDKVFVDEALAAVDLEAKADVRFRTYSLGMKQRLGLGCALMGNPELLVLDEPANGLDPSGMAAMRDLLRAQADRGRTVFLSSHLLAEISQVCDKVGVLHQGRLIAEGTPAEIESAYGGPSIVTVTCDDPERAAILVAPLDGVTSTSIKSGALQIGAPAGLTAIIAATLVNGGIMVSDIRHKNGSLEEAFLAMTGTDRAEQDGKGA